MSSNNNYKNSNKIIKFGMIGTGNSAHNIATSLSTITNAELIAVSSQKKDSAKDFASEFNIKNAVSTEGLLEIDEIDAVIISVPHNLHHPLTLQALTSGKHVLCEKPLAVNMKQGQEMINLAKEKNLKLGTFFQMRFNEASIKAKELIEKGALGKILHGQVNVLWYRDNDYYEKSSWRGKFETEGGGSLINQAAHSIDLLAWLMGKPKKLFGVWAPKTHKIEVDDNAAAVVIFDNDAYATIQTSTSVKPGYVGKVNIFGSEGGISLNGNELIYTHSDGEVETMNFDEEQVGSANDPKKFSLKAQVALIKDFISSILEDRQPKVDGAEGLRAIEIITAIYNSSGEKIIEF